MKKILAEILLVLGVFLPACTVTKYVPVETIREVHVKDSVYLRDTLIKIELEKARLSDFVDLGDTLVLQTDLARATAFVDSTKGILRGTIENIKPYIEKPIPVQHKIEYRDSIITKEKVVTNEIEVEKKVIPKWAWWSLIASIVMAAGIILFIFSPLASYFTKRG